MTALRLLAALLLLAWGTVRAHALEVVLDSGAGTLTIADNDADDLNPEDGTIDFVQVVGGVFQAEGRAESSSGLITKILTLEATPPAANAVFRNVGGTSATFSVTVDGLTFAAVGSPLGWTINYSGDADDPTPDDLAVPASTVALYVNGSASPLAYVSGPDLTGPIAPVDQPVAIATGTSGVDAGGDASSSRLVYTVTLGPGDQIELGDSHVDDDVITAWVFNQENHCISKMNAVYNSVATYAGLADYKCISLASRGDGGDATACVDGTDSGTQKKAAKVVSAFAALCDPVPAWGVNAATCCAGGTNDHASCTGAGDCPGGACTAGACLVAPLEQAANALTHDVFGASVVAVDGDVAGNCQRRVLNSVVKVMRTRWKMLQKCIQTNIATLADVGPCLTFPQPDPGNIHDRAVASLYRTTQGICVAKGVTPVGTVLPGRCTAIGDGDITDCLDARAACRLCRAANANEMVTPPADCDVFDDGESNASCP